MTEQNPEQTIQEQGEPDAGIQAVTPEEVPTVDTGMETPPDDTVDTDADANADAVDPVDADAGDAEAPGQVAAPELGAPGDPEPLPEGDADVDGDDLDDDDDDLPGDDDPEEIDDNEDDNTIVEPAS
jgi:hypothetical protein